MEPERPSKSNLQTPLPDQPVMTDQQKHDHVVEEERVRYESQPGSQQTLREETREVRTETDSSESESGE